MGSIGAQAYTQFISPVILQLASISGMWGITFLVTWFASTFVFAWERSFSWPLIRRGVVVYAGLMLAVLAYGNIRLAFPKTEMGTMRIHGIVPVDGREMLPGLKATQGENWQDYRALSAVVRETYFEDTIREARAGAQLVLWPENAVWLASEDEAALIATGRQIAMDEGVYLGLSYAVEYQDGTPYENKLVVIDPRGKVGLEHLKFGGQAIEGFRAGDGILRTMETPYGTLSGIICWDSFFQKPVLQAGRNGTDILLTTSFEFRHIVPMHAQITTMRAIENGVSLVRVADNGISFAVDPYGRVVASVDFFHTSQRVMVAQVPAYHVTTLYALIGDLFGWLAAAGWVGISVAGAILGRKEKRARSAAGTGPQGAL
jgi:apolipoprotein N-acyltransferase